MQRHPDASVYDRTYADYLDQLRSLPFKGREQVLGILAEKDSAVIPYFGDAIRWTPNGLSDGSGRRPEFSDCVVICRYLLMAPAVEPKPKDWVAYRDFPDAGPLTVFWADAVQGSLEKRFAGRIETLRKACTALGGQVPTMAMNADLCQVFRPLPKVPLLLVFNDADDEFPAAASLLLERRSAAYLDAESQAILGHRLADRLIAAA